MSVGSEGSADRSDEDAHRVDDDVLASDAERDDVVDRLNEACAAGRLTLAEFEERIEGALRARTRGDLDPLFAGLPVPAPPSTVPVSQGRTKVSVSVLGGLCRRGHWTLPPRMTHVALMGGSHLDLSDVELPGPDVTITIVAVLGGASVRLPETLRTEVTGMSILGGRRIDPSRPASSSAPLIRLRIFSILGGIRVETTRGRRSR